jgi:hypothetical protein
MEAKLFQLKIIIEKNYLHNKHNIIEEPVEDIEKVDIKTPEKFTKKEIQARYRARHKNLIKFHNYFYYDPIYQKQYKKEWLLKLPEIFCEKCNKMMKNKYSFNKHLKSKKHNL